MKEQFPVLFDQLISRLPAEQNRQFEEMITEFVISQLDEDLPQFVKFLETILESNENKHRRYVAFVSLATLYRRQEEVPYLNLLFYKYEKDFVDEPLFLHYRALKHKADGELQKSIEDSYKALENPTLANNSGVLHNFAESVISLIESKEEIHYKRIPELEKEGYEKLEKAIKLDQNYAKYYATKARFLTVCNRQVKRHSFR